jgi:hypothetical protein
MSARKIRPIETPFWDRIFTSRFEINFGKRGTFADVRQNGLIDALHGEVRPAKERRESELRAQDSVSKQ